ncbi:MAG: hypothetical protein J1F20_08240 [Muribaculaceae bacterium]|nr:hypothetical protein [Muribaculaceae bacterium]
MTFINIIAAIAAKMPYTVYRLRFFKHFYKIPKIKGNLSTFDSLYQYVINHGIKNGSNDRWGILADKYASRFEVERLLGSEHLIPLLGHWENPENIDFDALPDSFILKTNNGCGTNIFIHNKNSINRSAIINQLKKSLQFPYPQLTGQLHYAQIKPCVIAEKLMLQGNDSKSLTDYKIHCVNGEPIELYIFSDRDETNHFDFTMKAYTPQWREMPEGTNPDDVKDQPIAPDRPEWLDEMLDAARKLSAGEEYMRVDFYHIDGQIFFGEMTLTPDTIFNKCYKPYQRAMRYILDLIRKDSQLTTSL